MMYDGYGAGWGWSMVAIMLVSWTLVVAGVVWAAVWIRNQRRSDDHALPPPGSPLELLDKRFAAGEIDDLTYTYTRDLLTRPGTR